MPITSFKLASKYLYIEPKGSHQWSMYISIYISKYHNVIILSSYTNKPGHFSFEKKLSMTNIDEAVVDNVRDAASLEERESKHGPPWKCDNKFR